MPQSIVLKPGTNNALELNFPHAYQCRVSGYYHNQSLLVVEIKPDDDTYLDHLYIVFENVQYFDGSLFWAGANLRVATREERFEFTKQKELVITSQELLVFEGSNYQIHLLAGSWIAVLEELPERFR